MTYDDHIKKMEVMQYNESLAAKIAYNIKARNIAKKRRLDNATQCKGQASSDK